VGSSRGAQGSKDQLARHQPALTQLSPAASQAKTPSPELAPLIRILAREEALYSDLLEITSLERAAVVAARLPDLKVAVERKQQVLARLANLEDRRIAWLDSYADNRGIDPTGLTLASIIDASPAPDRDILARLYKGLTRRIDQLKELNHKTRSLLEAILGSIDKSLHYLLCDDSFGQTYRAHGGLQPKLVTSNQLLDRRV